MALPTSRPVSARRPVRRTARRLVGLVLLIGALVAVSTASVLIGAKPLTPGAVWHALATPDGTPDDLVVRSLRIPRTVLGLLVGVALGTAGTVMQGHTRNPIADPGLLGVTQGAGFAVVLGSFAWGVTGLSGSVWLAFLGAGIAGAAVFWVASAGRGGATPVTLALTGAAISALLLALTSGLVLVDQQSLETYRFWKVGAISGHGPELPGQILPFLLVGVLLAAATAPGLNLLALGEDVARSLGQRIVLSRMIGVAAIVVLTGTAVAACGPIGFAGVLVPHLARAVTGADYRWILPFSALLGAVVVVGADVVGRLAAGSGELPVGIVLALVGAPFFVLLVRRPRLVRL